jgi:hypothetical protein
VVAMLYEIYPETGRHWLERHLEEFVKPHVGKIPLYLGNDLLVNSGGAYKWSDQTIKFLLNFWEDIKMRSKGRTIVLPGRDTWEFEILARLEGWDTVFRPDISSITKLHIKEDYSKCYATDSGNSGSVPRALKITDFHMVNGPYGHQLLPEKKVKAVNNGWFDLDQPGVLYYHLEGGPKYWTRADLNPDTKEIIQKLTSVANGFSRAALITQCIAYKAMPEIKPRIAKRVIRSMGRFL